MSVISMKSKSKVSFNGMTAKEWTLASKSVWTARDVSSAREEHHRKHGATFPVALAENAVRMYSNKGDLVLDPFLGVADTLIACRNLSRRGIGFELYEKYYDISKKLLSQDTIISSKKCKQRPVHGDCRGMNKYIKPGTVQLTFTSPPYANFIQQSIEDRKKTHKKSKLVLENNSNVSQYGSDDRDFGNLGYAKFLENVTDLMKVIYKVTKPGGYNVWVVKDHRIAKKKIPYVPVHSDVMAAARKTGFVDHDLIVWDQNAQRSLVVLGYPSVFYVNINHTFLVVMRKPT